MIKQKYFRLKKKKFHHSYIILQEANIATQFLKKDINRKRIKNRYLSNFRWNGSKNYNSATTRGHAHVTTLMHANWSSCMQHAPFTTNAFSM